MWKPLVDSITTKTPNSLSSGVVAPACCGLGGGGRGWRLALAWVVGGQHGGQLSTDVYMFVTSMQKLSTCACMYVASLERRGGWHLG